MTLGRPWTDRLPVEDDPDVAAAVTIDGLGAWAVEGSDVLSDLGSSQKLVTSAVDGRLAIKDLLVEDHPTFLRIAVPQRSRTAR